MSKAPSPLLGYNNNVRHKNKIFHIQTEDSGVKYGHIITHLFMDGGRILKSVKTSYTEYLGNEKMADIVREMMKQQHKSLFIALRDGKFDHLVEGADISQQTKALTAQAAAQAVAALPVEPSAAPLAAAAVVPAMPGADATQKMAPMPAVVLTPPPQVALAPPPPPPKAPSAPPPPAAPAPIAVRMTPTRVNPVPAVVRSAPPPAPTIPDAPPQYDAADSSPMTERNPHELTLDIDALERAAAATETSSPVFKPASDLPPPPTNLFREKTTTGKYRTLPPPGTGSSPPGAPTPAPRPAISTEKRNPTAPAANANAPNPATVKRYAPTRPAAIFGQGRPQQGKTVFGEDLISDKSLDEVILSYLADDLEPPAKK